MDKIEKIVEQCKDILCDINYTVPKQWKNKEKNRVLVGYLPIYFPREIVWAANGLAVGIMGAGDFKQVVKGDAYYQSYICHMPRGIIDLALDGHLNDFDGFVFPSICDVIRNLSGIFQVEKIGKFSKYLDYPQNFNKEIGGKFYKSELEDILEKIYQINKIHVEKDQLNEAIRLYNINRRYLRIIYDIRETYPWRLSAYELYVIVRAGLSMPVNEHNQLLEIVIEEINKERGVPMDNIRVIVWGAFCEQMPLNLIKSIESAGCYIIDDDFFIGSRWITKDIDDHSNDPLNALTEAFLNNSTFSSSVYDVDNPKEKRLVELAKQRKADGIIFASPSFCDPALLDTPLCQKHCEKNNMKYISFQFSENTGQFKVIKEQVGAFSDSIKLWEDITV